MYIIIYVYIVLRLKFILLVIYKNCKILTWSFIHLLEGGLNCTNEDKSCKYASNLQNII